MPILLLASATLGGPHLGAEPYRASGSGNNSDGGTPAMPSVPVDHGPSESVPFSGPSGLTNPDPRYASLPPITFRAVNTREQQTVRLYRSDGTLDPEAISRLSYLFRDLPTGTPSPIVPRTLKLLVRIATHFQANQIDVVSAYRTGRRADGSTIRREGYHGVGSAIDFIFPGTHMVEVAAYARTLAHVGVGYYPRQGFVHLDSREQTFFWESNCGRHRSGWNRPLDRSGVESREAAWSPANDSPWDPPGTQFALVLHPSTQQGAMALHRHSLVHAHRANRHRHLHHRRALHVFRGAQ